MWLFNPPMPGRNEWERWLKQADGVRHIGNGTRYSNDQGTGDARFVCDCYELTVALDADKRDDVIELPDAAGAWLLRRTLVVPPPLGAQSIHAINSAGHPGNELQRNLLQFRTERNAYALWTAKGPPSVNDGIDSVFEGGGFAWRLAYNPPFPPMRAQYGTTLYEHIDGWVLWFGPDVAALWQAMNLEEVVAFPLWFSPFFKAFGQHLLTGFDGLSANRFTSRLTVGVGQVESFKDLVGTGNVFSEFPEAVTIRPYYP